MGERRLSSYVFFGCLYVTYILCLSLVQDRGPAGDFVYGTHAKLPTAEKLKRYAEFQDFDAQCAADGVLLCKLLFVADRDTIAKTIGKRLAQKKIAQDLRTWLNASAGHGCARDGLDEIDRHIDPTDFLAFNAYQDNLHKFANFARHTDKVTDHGSSGGTGTGWSNPWLVSCHMANDYLKINFLSRLSTSVLL